MMQIRKKGTPIAVLGASGHTGRFVVQELQRRGLQPIAIGRDLARLAACGFGEQGIPMRQAEIGDAAALDAALAGTALVIHCAGPFLDTATPVLEAALRARIHYLDLTAEQGSASHTLEQFGAAAQAAGILAVPGMAFFGALADLLASVAADGAPGGSFDVGIALEYWHPTTGTRLTGARNTLPRMAVVDGQAVPIVTGTSGERRFGPPFGLQAVAEVSFSEMPQIRSHLQPQHVHTWLNLKALQDIRDPATPPPQASQPGGSTGQRFLVDVLHTAAGQQRRASASGQDIYAISAPLVAEAAARILSGAVRQTAGAWAPGALFDPAAFLTALHPYLSFQLHDTEATHELCA